MNSLSATPSVSPSPISSSPLNTVTADATATATPTFTTTAEEAVQQSGENVRWASLIKEQHRHLQSAVTLAASRPAREATSGSSGALPGSTYETDLQAWRAAVRGAAAEERLSTYAVAMHDLATQYWDPAPTQIDPVSCAAPLTTDLSHDTPSVGAKRRRDDAELQGDTSSTTPPRHVLPAADSTTTTTVAPRRYSDRLQCCLGYTAAYFLGDVAAVGHDEKPDGSVCVSGAPLRTGPSAHHPPVFIPVNDVTFRLLPGVMARVVKPLRRTFFNLNGRMATGAEVRELLRACTPEASLMKEEREGERTLVQQLMTESPTGRVAAGESAWRRGEDTAWAAALRYTRLGSPPAASTSPPPLWVLDVGSCYGPFCGKSLPRIPPCAAVPLRVTSMDLAPYVAKGAGGATSSHDIPPSPRVWQGDWLHMQFVSAAEGAAVVTGEVAAVGCAEEGRLWYRVHSPATDKQHATHFKALSAVAVRLESYDALYFCLLLSYIPTPRLRFLACLHACLALKEGGLLVIVSTRTQGSRRWNWMREWTTCLATIGLHRVQQCTQEKIVGMAFAKTCPSEEVRRSWQSAAGRAAWVQAMMATKAAENGLRIIADDVHDKAGV